MAIKTPSILPELQKFVETLGPDVPYDKLLSTAAEAGWQYRLVQKEVTPTPDGCTLVTFEVQVGRDSAFDVFDAVSIKLNPSPGPVSFAARVQLLPTLIYMFFGRMPETAPAAEPARTIDASQGTDDIVLDFDAEPAAAPDEAADRGFVPDTFEPLNVVERKEPDGVPIFKDLYSVGGPDVTADVVIAAVLEVIKPFAVRVSSKEELLAVIEKNPDLLGFMKDFGTDAEREALKGHLDRALARLSEPPREVRIPGGTGSPEARRRTPKAA